MVHGRRWFVEQEWRYWLCRVHSGGSYETEIWFARFTEEKQLEALDAFMEGQSANFYASHITRSMNGNGEMWFAYGYWDEKTLKEYRASQAKKPA